MRDTLSTARSLQGGQLETRPDLPDDACIFVMGEQQVAAQQMPNSGHAQDMRVRQRVGWAHLYWRGWPWSVCASGSGTTREVPWGAVTAKTVSLPIEARLTMSSFVTYSRSLLAGFSVMACRHGNRQG